MAVKTMFEVKIGDEVVMVRHDQAPAIERPPGPYKVLDVRVIWDIHGHWQAPDVFFQLLHPNGWREWRPWYLCQPAKEDNTG